MVTMKKNIFLSSITFFIALICASDTMAANSKIYFGADYIYSDIKYKESSEFSLKDNYNVISPVIGFNSYGLGLEAFYQFSDEAENDHGIKSSMTAYGIDLMGEAPLSDHFYLVVSIGLAKYKFEIKEKNGYKYDQSVNGPRFGIGLQFDVLPHVAIRTMYHYTSLNAGKTDNYEAISEFSGGVRISF